VATEDILVRVLRSWHIVNNC